jgi:hypothetical protein
MYIATVVVKILQVNPRNPQDIQKATTLEAKGEGQTESEAFREAWEGSGAKDFAEALGQVARPQIVEN